MMTLVSRRTLPAIRLDLFATFLDGMRHGIKIRGINRTYEAHKVPARRTGGRGEAAREIQNLPLLRSVQAANLVDNLVFDSLRHSETNLGKGFLNVKSAPFAKTAKGWRASISELAFASRVAAP